MISLGVQANRAYFGYGTNKGGAMQIVDRQKLLNGPKEPTPENLRYPDWVAARPSPVSRGFRSSPSVTITLPLNARRSLY
jgi:hypothetical protein